MIKKKTGIFDPFEDKISRQVRNTLAGCILKALCDPAPDLDRCVADTLDPPENAQYISDYIDNRKESLARIRKRLHHLSRSDKQTWMPVLLWNQGLFFELHEWLEKEWTAETGSRKKALQACILCAIVYEHLSYDRPGPARRLAQKTLSLLEDHINDLPGWMDAQVMIKALKRLDPDPPLLRLPEPLSDRSPHD